MIGKYNLLLQVPETFKDVMDSDEYYLTRYCQVVGDGAVGFVSRWSHKCLERMAKQTEAQNVLELGAWSW